MKVLAALLLLALNISGNAFSQSSSKSVTDSIVISYKKDVIHSAILNEERTIKVYLPPHFKKNGKYPVLYVLDESWMFKPTVLDVIKLSSFNVIPPCIVIGISSSDRSKDLRPDLNTGELTRNSKNFLDYLTKEVSAHIVKNYTSPAFNILIGHSDGATFAQTAMTNAPDAFRGVVCISQNLWGSGLQQYIDYSKTAFMKNRYYYVASATNDHPSRIKSGKELDSLFGINVNANLKVQNKMYKADHSGIVGVSLTDGIAFIFSDYRQPNDHNELLIDSLKKANTDPVVFIKNITTRINENYGIELKPQFSDDIHVIARLIIINKEQAKNYVNYCINNTKVDDQFNSSIAQLHERIKEYNIALEYWERYLNDPKSYKKHFFYFRRPIELLAYKMNQPERAIDFAEKWEKAAPDNVKLSFRYFIAKVAADKHIKTAEGVEAINYFIKYYHADQTQYTLKEAEEVLKILNENKKN